MTAPEAPVHAGDLPCIRIERTPANDVYLLLTALGLGAAAERVLDDPMGFLVANRAEARTLARLLQARMTPARPRIDESAPVGACVPAPAGSRRGGPAGARRRPARDEAGRPLGSSRSLLR